MESQAASDDDNVSVSVDMESSVTVTVRPCKLAYISDSDDDDELGIDDEDSSDSDCPYFLGVSFDSETEESDEDLSSDSDGDGDDRPTIPKPNGKEECGSGSDSDFLDFFGNGDNIDRGESDEDSSGANGKNTCEAWPKWKKIKSGSTQRNISFAPTRQGVNKDVIPPSPTPLQCFHALLPKEMIETILQLINDKAKEKYNLPDENNEAAGGGGANGGLGSWQPMHVGEIYKYLLTLVSMGVAFPPLHMTYWAKNFLYDGKWFRKVFPKERFDQVHGLLNEALDFKEVGKSKLKGFVSNTIQRFQGAFYPGLHLNVEELVIGTKQGWAHTSDDTGKPNNYRVKTVGLVDNESSYIFNLNVCFGPSKRCFRPNKMKPDQINKLLDKLLTPCFEGHHLYLDRQYSSLPILRHLAEEKKYYYIGLVDEKKHKGIPQAVTTKKKLNPGQIKWYMQENDTNLIAKYRDTKFKITSSLISNHAKVETKFLQGMHMPQMLHDYKLMIKGGEKIHDIMERYGRYNHPSKNWDERFNKWFFEIILWNAFVLYKLSQPKDAKEASYMKFKIMLTCDLCQVAGGLYNIEEMAGASGDVTNDSKECLCYRYGYRTMGGWVQEHEEEEEEEDIEEDFEEEMENRGDRCVIA